MIIHIFQGDLTDTSARTKHRSLCSSTQRSVAFIIMTFINTTFRMDASVSTFQVILKTHNALHRKQSFKRTMHTSRDTLILNILCIIRISSCEAKLTDLVAEYYSLAKQEYKRTFG